MRRTWVLASVFLLALAYAGAALLGWLGRSPQVGEIVRTPRPERAVTKESEGQRAAARRAGNGATDKQILFGDLHVHSTFSMDAFLKSLPILQGEGAHPPADACDFARFCSALDFFSINDHAEGLTPDMWRETIDSIRQCNDVAGDPVNPDLVAFLGWEWTQIAALPEEHYGHKNVVLRGLGDQQIPTRPIAAAGAAFDGMRQTRGRLALGALALADPLNRQHYYDFAELRRQVQETPVCAEGVDVRELPADCIEAAATPRVLFEKLAQWNLDSLVIPHGNAWGNTTPAGVSWDKQLENGNHDPGRQTLIEVYSGHGNSEPYRSFRHVVRMPDGALACPAARPDFEPPCWRAGEIIRARCLAASLGEAECDARAAEARRNAVEADANAFMTVPGQQPEDWLDAGQCRDCFQPAFDLRPGGSVQYALTLSTPDAPPEQGRFRFGFISSSDTHFAKAGSGYKEVGPLGMTDTYGVKAARRRAILQPDRGDPEPLSKPLDRERVMMLPGGNIERSASFYYTGGLVAVHAAGRDRDSIWRALERKQVYGTSGPRILLWFDLLSPARPDGLPRTMGSEVRTSEAPRFRVRAAGALRQKPGCPDYATSALGPERLAALCKDECHHPSDERLAITRVEVVRIRPRTRPDEKTRDLIEDPWLVHACARDPAGCAFEFEDPDFAASGRGAIYYVRAIQEPTPHINGDPLRCERDASGACLSVDRCRAGGDEEPDDDCLSDAEARAWSSPIFVDYGR